MLFYIPPLQYTDVLTFDQHNKKQTALRLHVYNVMLYESLVPFLQRVLHGYIRMKTHLSLTEYSFVHNPAIFL